MVRNIILAVALAVSACGQRPYTTSTRDLADDADANARSALAQLEELRSKVDDLESSNRRLESRVDELESESASIRASFASHQTWSNGLAQKHNTLLNDFWRYQKWNEQRFASLGRPWESL